jgi:MFS family permease
MGIASAFYMPTLIALAASLSDKAGFDGLISKNQTYNHAGNVIAAIFIGLMGKFTNNQGIFYCLLILAVFCTISALSIPQKEIKQTKAAEDPAGDNKTSIWSILKYKPLLIFLTTAFCFTWLTALCYPWLVARYR